MKVLDGIESGYIRTPAQAKLYDGTIVDCKVYSQTAEFLNNAEKRANDKPPMERYIDLMYDGAKHYGVKQEYLDYLMTLEK